MISRYAVWRGLVVATAAILLACLSVPAQEQGSVQPEKPSGSPPASKPAAKSAGAGKSAPSKDAAETPAVNEDNAYAVYEVGPDGRTVKVVKGRDVFDEEPATPKAPAASAGEGAGNSEEPPSTEPATPPPPPKHREFRSDARMAEDAWAVAVGYTEGLPDFMVEELVWRYQGQGSNPDWRAVDWVTVDVRSVDGRESYTNIRLKGKPAKEEQLIDKGSWSSGEYSSTLLDLFSPATAAVFQFEGVTTIATTGVRKYTYRVAKDHSHWRIDVEGDKIQPAYKGTVFVDPRSMRVMRIEMQAVNLPSDYPLDTVEGDIDYGLARIGSDYYLMPIKAENLACQRGTPYCSLNRIEFRNYRKFTAESTIDTVDSTVDFGGAGSPPPAEKKKPF